VSYAQDRSLIVSYWKIDIFLTMLALIPMLITTRAGPDHVWMTLWLRFSRSPHPPHFCSLPVPVSVLEEPATDHAATNTNQFTHLVDKYIKAEPSSTCFVGRNDRQEWEDNF